MSSMRLRMRGRRIHRGHLAPAGHDGVRGVRHSPAAVSPLLRARGDGHDTILGERPRLAPGSDPKRQHRSAARDACATQLAHSPSTRKPRASSPVKAAPVIGGRRRDQAVSASLGYWGSYRRPRPKRAGSEPLLSIRGGSLELHRPGCCLHEAGGRQPPRDRGDRHAAAFRPARARAAAGGGLPCGRHCGSGRGGSGGQPSRSV